MRKPKISLLVLITIIFSAFTLGLFLGRTQSKGEIIVSVPEVLTTIPSPAPEAEDEVPTETERVTFPIAINQADKEAFMALPGIGEVLAKRIVEYRELNGKFTSPEELLNVEGVGEKRLEEILDLITVGG